MDAHALSSSCIGCAGFSGRVTPAVASSCRAPQAIHRRTGRLSILAQSASSDSAAAVGASPSSSSDSGGATQVRAEVTRRIKALGRAGKAREAVTQLAEMARLGVQPDTLAATALVDACARNGKMEMAQSVFDELFGEFLQPDAVAFSVLVRGYGELDPPRWASISGLLNVMDQQFGLPPSTVIYNTLLDICARTNDEERGYEVIRRMEAAGLQPNDMTEMAVKNRKSLRSYLRKAFSNNAGSSSDDEGGAE